MLPEIDRPSRRYHALGQVLMWSAIPIFALEVVELVIRLTPPPPEGGMALAALVGLLGLVQTVVYVIIAIMWLIFLFTASANLHLDGVKGLRFSPAGAVGWWFAPVANLVMGFRITSEIWRASADQMTWQKRKAPLLLRAWWLCFAIPQAMILLGLFSTLPRMMAGASPGADPSAPPALPPLDDPATLMISALNLVGIVLFALVVRGISANQLRLADIAADQPSLAPVPA